MWKVEIIQRSGNKIFVFYCVNNDEDAEPDHMYIPRGQIEIQGKEEEEKWQNLIKHLND